MPSSETLKLLVAAALAFSAAPARAAAQEPAAHQYALVVGSNAGGAGQQQLHYAEADALRVAEVLGTIGGFDPSRVVRLVAPSPGEVVHALDGVRGNLERHAARGEQAYFFFFYSGHARADALNLGDERISLDALRKSILALPATLSVVVLDACQSGAFSRVKGVGPATDFSFNSVARLNTEGVAVMASSTASEFSQESDELRAGYFTHHLLVALRGAADADQDGRVSLAEAYGYVHNRVLAATAASAVGEQHVTLETDLKGRGDVPLSYPASADAQLALPAALAGDVLVQSMPGMSPLAELSKAPGQKLLLALPSGRYGATVRQGASVRRCTLELTDGEVTELDPQTCESIVAAAPERTKGLVDGTPTPAPGAAAGPVREIWFVELGLGADGDLRDDYIDRLETFGYARASRHPLRYGLAGGYRIAEHFALGLSFAKLDEGEFVRVIERKERIAWSTYAVGPFLQADHPLGLPELRGFARARVGLTYAPTTFEQAAPPDVADDAGFPAQTQARPPTEQETEDNHVRGYLGATLGLAWTLLPPAGLFAQGSYLYAPAVPNLAGDTHDSGGFSFLAGLRLRNWE